MNDGTRETADWLELAMRYKDYRNGLFESISTRVFLPFPIEYQTLPALREYAEGLAVRLYELIESRGLKKP